MSDSKATMNRIVPEADTSVTGIRSEISGEEYVRKVLEEGYDGQAPANLFETAEAQILTPGQVEKGQDRLKFKHPLKNSSIFEVLPILAPFKVCAKPKEKAKKDSRRLKRQNTFAVLQGEGKKKDQSDEAIKKLIKKLFEDDYSEQKNELEISVDNNQGLHSSVITDTVGSSESEDELMNFYGDLL